MRTADILHELTAIQVKDIARRLGYSITGLAKAEIVSLLARSLAKRLDSDGSRLGAAGAVAYLLDQMNADELYEAIEGKWFSGDGRVYVTTDGLSELSEDKLRDLLAELVEAEDEDPTTVVSDVAEKWRDCFEEVDDEDADWDDSVNEEDEEEDEEEEGDDEEEEEEPEEDEGEEEEQESWRRESIITIAPGEPLPEGFFVGEKRRSLSHQERALERLHQWWADSRDQSGVLCMPTGAGKTRTMVRFLLASLQPNTTVLWLTHRTELMDQAVRELVTEAVHEHRQVTIGRFQRGMKAEEEVDILVASVSMITRRDNLNRALARQRRCNLVVVDECHHAVARTWARVLKELKNRGARLLGMSATPTRANEKEISVLVRLFPRVIHEENALELMRSGVLARPKFEFVATQRRFEASAEERRHFQRFKDLPESLVKAIAQDSDRNRRIVNHYVDGGLRRFGPTLFFCANIEHAERITSMLARRDVSARVISSETDPHERERAIEDFRHRRFSVLVNVALLTEGTDLPTVETVFIARPTRSPILFAQMVGRGLRGPHVGGTSECQIVVFFDEVMGLASEHLTTSYSDEHKAKLAVGFDVETSVPSEGGEAPLSNRARARMQVQESTEEAVLHERMRSLESLLSHTKRPTTGRSTAAPLLGWWYVDAEQRRRYLPVFEPDSFALNGAIADLIAYVRGTRALPALPRLRCLPEVYVQRFFAKVARSKAVPEFVSIDSVSTETQQHFARAVLEGGSRWLEPGLQSQAPPPPPPPPPSPPLDDLSAVREAVRFLPPEMQRPYLERIYQERFSNRYSDLLEFILAVLR